MEGPQSSKLMSMGSNPISCYMTKEEIKNKLKNNTCNTCSFRFLGFCLSNNRKNSILPRINTCIHWTLCWKNILRSNK
jgi:hypothetical protein